MIDYIKIKEKQKSILKKKGKEKKDTDSSSASYPLLSPTTTTFDTNQLVMVQRIHKFRPLAQQRKNYEC